MPEDAIVVARNMGAAELLDYDRSRRRGLVLEVTGECDPCSRMEEVAPGLKAALLPHWRGGVCTRVIEGGAIGIGEQVRIER